MDVHTKEQRSYNMSRIGSKNTKPELILFENLRKRGLGYRKHYQITGKPDAAPTKHKIAIFIDGEYWHGKNFLAWKNQLTEFWHNKIADNISRDRKNRSNLKSHGWTVIRIWGRDMVKNPDKCLKKIEALLLVGRENR